MICSSYEILVSILAYIPREINSDNYYSENPA